MHRSIRAIPAIPAIPGDSLNLDYSQFGESEESQRLKASHFRRWEPEIRAFLAAAEEAEERVPPEGHEKKARPGRYKQI